MLQMTLPVKLVISFYHSYPNDSSPFQVSVPTHTAQASKRIQNLMIVELDIIILHLDQLTL